MDDESEDIVAYCRENLDRGTLTVLINAERLRTFAANCKADRERLLQDNLDLIAENTELMLSLSDARIALAKARAEL